MSKASPDAVVGTIHGHYQRQATPEVWSEVDELRYLVARSEAALIRALSDVGCTTSPGTPFVQRR
jgi:hypothetical protein